MNEPAAKRNIALFVAGAAVGLAYGLVLRYGSRAFPNPGMFQIMTLGFLFFLPFAIGFSTIFVIERRRAQSIWVWFLLPWIPMIAGELAAVALLWEGWICFVMFTPIALVASTLGGTAAGLIAHYGGRDDPRMLRWCA